MTTNPALFKHPLSAAPIFNFAPDVKEVDLLDVLEIKLAHLAAQLAPTYGECGQHLFRMHSPEILDNHAWSCAAMLQECRELLRHATGG